MITSAIREILISGEPTVSSKNWQIFQSTGRKKLSLWGAAYPNAERKLLNPIITRSYKFESLRTRNSPQVRVDVH